jgi:hypothetical protein
MKPSDGGKGSSPRPFGVDNKTFENNWKSIEGFGDSWLERKKREEAERAKREEALDEMVRVSQEMGLYDEFDDKVIMKNEFYE